MTIPARPIDPAKDRDRRLAESRDAYSDNPLPVPRPPPRRVALAVGALVRLRRHEGPDRLPRPDPQGSDRRLPRDGHDAGRHAALREGQHRLPARALARAAHHEPAPRPSGARLHAAPPRRSASSASAQIIAICREHGYDYVFAGYGFMAEDAELRARARGGRPPLHRPVLVHADGGRREGRGQAHRDREPGVGDAGHQRRDRAHAAAQAPRPRRARGASRKEHGLDVPALGDDGAPLAGAGRGSCSRPRTASTSTSSRSTSSARRSGSRPSACSREQPGPALPPEGDRRRRRQGPAHLRRRRAGARRWCARSSPR